MLRTRPFEFFWHSFIKASGETEVLGCLLKSFWKFFVLRSFFACICLDLQQVIVGEHLQQEQWGGDAAGVAVLPALGAAVPWLSASGLQVRSGVTRVADQPEPGVGWPQVNPSPQIFSFLRTSFFHLFNLGPLCSKVHGEIAGKGHIWLFSCTGEAVNRKKMTLRLSLNLVGPPRRS